MSDQEISATLENGSEERTVFDELASLVPEERQAAYYRVIAHTRTLSPNDEMLRILEAMGVLALLTRQTPAAIAAERKLLRAIMESSASQATAVEKRMEQTQRASNRGSLNYLRNWQRAWTHPELQSCWARVCGSPFSDQVYRLHVQLFRNPALN